MNFRNLLLVSAAVLYCTASMSGQLNHTWVSGSGSDSNTCSFTSPCLTFQNTLSKTAAYGTITAKDASDFGPIVISQPVTIDGNNLGSITLSSGVLINVFGAVDVTIQNLNINGMGSSLGGIEIGGGNATIHNCEIMNIGKFSDGIYFYGAGTLTVEDSRIESFIGLQGTGIEIAAEDAENVVVRNTVINASASNASTGFMIDQSTGPVNASLQNVMIMGAGNAAVWTATGDTQVTGSVLTQSDNGVYADNGSTISVASSLITSNTTGVCSNTTSKVRLDNNDIYDNVTAIANCGGIVKTSTTNKTSGTISIPASDVSDSVTF